MVVRDTQGRETSIPSATNVDSWARHTEKLRVLGGELKRQTEAKATVRADAIRTEGERAQ